MSEGKLASQGRSKVPRRRLIAIVSLVVFAFSIFIGWGIFWYQNAGASSLTGPPVNVQCGLACGPPIDVPVILGAHSTQSQSVATCQIVAQNLTTRCEISISGGDQGTISLSLKSENGDSRVQFATNSSEPSFIQFTSVPNCTYSSAPDYNAGGCVVLQSGSMFQFNYTVSQILSTSKQAIFTIVVTKTCCWP